MDEMQKIQYAANSYYNRGLEMAKERNLSGAARFLKRALQFNKYHTDARNLLGLIFYEMGETSDALIQWVIVLHLPVGKRVLHLPLLDLRLSGPALYVLHVPGGFLVIVVDLKYLEQGFSGFRVVPMFHIEKRQKQMRFHKIRLLVDDPLKLQDRQIITVILGIE